MGHLIGSYWDSFCFCCQKNTYHPEGFCSICGWDDISQDFMSEERHKNCENMDDVMQRVVTRDNHIRVSSKRK